MPVVMHSVFPKKNVSVSEKKGAYMPFFSGDSYLELKGLHTYGHDLQ